MKRILIVCFLLSTVFTSIAQPFAKEVAAFKKQDSIAMPPKNAILLIGSSSFTLWKDVQSYFPAYTIVNRAFGGSSLPDVIRYEAEVIFPYQPKQIIIYCGENDFAGSDTITVTTVVERFKQLFTDIRNRYPKIPVAYVSMKPSPSRKHLMPKYEAGNEMIQKFLKKKKKTAFINIYNSMLQADGTPMTDIFLGDNLHMNKKGYAIWQKIIEPYLLK